MFNKFSKLVFSVVAVFLFGAGLVTQVALGSTLDNANVAIVQEVSPNDGGGNYGGGG